MKDCRLTAVLVTAFLTFNISLSALESGPDLRAGSALLYDYSTGRILFEKNADQSIPPASMTKLITLYLGWEYLENGGDPSEKVEITSTGSAFSRPEGSSLMLLEEGQHVSFLDIMKGLAIASGNDAAYALAEHISGSPDLFVGEMNRLMERLGYGNMHFVDPDGWSAGNRVTAREYASFSAHYINRFPHSLSLVHSNEYFSYPLSENLPDQGGRILTPRKKKNTNILLGEVEGVDGLKTGYIDESGFNFTATAKRGNSRYIAVIMGILDVSYFEGIELRAKEAEELLEYGFRNYKTLSPALPLFDEIPLWEGADDVVAVEAVGEPLFTLSVDEMPSFAREIDIPEELTAPLTAGQEIGSVRYSADGVVLASFPVVTSMEAEKGNIFKVLWHKILRLFNP